MDRTELTDREVSTILAALRYWQGAVNGMLPQPPAIVELASDGGRYPSLTGVEIDELCEQININGLMS